MATTNVHTRGFDLEKLTLHGSHYRDVMWTGTSLQLVRMVLLPGETIDAEVHAGDQLLRPESGAITVTTGTGVRHRVAVGQAICIPAGTRHAVVACAEGATLYSVYAPPEHAAGTVDVTKP